MLQMYLLENLNKANFEKVEDGKRYYGEIRNLQGVWATGKTLEECRQNLLETLEGWLVIRLKKNLPIPGFPSARGIKIRYSKSRKPVHA